jgi:uncharacterized protein YdhG (YjbR/CyaY superfamily)
MKKIIFSNTLKKVDWQNSVFAEKDLVSTVKELKRQQGKLISAGSINIASQLFKENLIDEFWFAVHPVISGKGPRLFDGIDVNSKLQFVDSKKFNSGVIVLHYKKTERLLMKSDQKTFKNIDEYFSTIPKDVRTKLQKIRETIHKTAPEAEEAISYNMPAFKQNNVLVYFAAFKNHIGFFPTAKPIEVFKEELKGYKTSRGTIQFPINEKIPLGLISKITKYRVKEVEKKSSERKKSV